MEGLAHHPVANMNCFLRTGRNPNRTSMLRAHLHFAIMLSIIGLLSLSRSTLASNTPQISYLPSGNKFPLSIKFHHHERKISPT
jgi:hypothetical protein